MSDLLPVVLLVAFEKPLESAVVLARGPAGFKLHARDVIDIPIRAELVHLIRSLQPGQRIRITQNLRVGSTASWTMTVEGTFRNVSYLATGISTDRVPQDNIIVPTVHFTKDNGELSSVSIDEHTQIELVNK